MICPKNPLHNRKKPIAILQHLDEVEALDDLQKVILGIIVIDLSIHFLLTIALYLLITINNYICYIHQFTQRINHVLQLEMMPQLVSSNWL